jgi:hypothetical protein
MASSGRALGRPHTGFSPLAVGFKENLFHFSFGLNSSLNFKNSYLSVQYSKNHEISSVGFVIMSSI